MTDFGHNRHLRTTLRFIAFVVGLMACIVPRMAQGQGMNFPGGPSGSAQGVTHSARRGFGAQFTGGHQAGHVVGREESVSHIGLTPYMRFNNTMFFGDSRLVRANSEGLAWSFGGGVRHYLAELDSVIGINGYADFDEINDAKFEQFGWGLEWLGKWVDARANYYSPSGRDSALLGNSFVDGSSEFVGNTITFQTATNRFQVLRGYDAEIGFQIPGPLPQKHDVKVFGGGYWYDGSAEDDISGFKLRLEGRPLPAVSLNLQVTDDQFYDTTVALNAEFSFGGLKRGWGIPRDQFHRLTDRVQRNLTMVARNSVVTNTVTDPSILPKGATSEVPLNIIHVNSDPVDVVGTDPAGSLLNPYTSLGQALGTVNSSMNDIIFVHGNSTFDDETIAIPDSIRVLGEGISTDGAFVEHFVSIEGLGDIPLPASQDFLGLANRPILNSSSPGASSVTLLPDSGSPLVTEFSGFILNDTTGIVADDVNCGVLNDNTINNSVTISDALGNPILGDGIRLTNVEGEFDIFNTQIINSAGHGLFVEGDLTDESIATPIINFRSEFETGTVPDPGFARIEHANAGTNSLRVENFEGVLNMQNSTIDDGVGDADGVTTPGGGILITTSGTGNNPATGNVIVDNAAIHGAGIEVSGDIAGRIQFFSTSAARDGTLVNYAPENAVTITGLDPSGSVEFRQSIGAADGQVSLTVRNPGSTTADQAGISLTSLAGDVIFDDQVNIVFQGDIDTVTTNAHGVVFQNNLSTGSAQFENLSIREERDNATGLAAIPGGNGILISGNAADSRFEAEIADIVGSEFGFVTGLESLLITADEATTEFGDIDVDNRTLQGIQIFQLGVEGEALFGDATVNNQLGNAVVAVDIQESLGDVSFDSLEINDAQNAVGVQSGLFMNLNGNQEDDILPRIEFDDLDIESLSGVALLATNNYASVLVRDGTVEATGDTAIDVENTALWGGEDVDDNDLDVQHHRFTNSMTFSSVSSTDSPDHGIRLVNLGDRSDFFAGGDLDDDDTAGDGGEITGAAIAGVELQNAARVTLERLEISGNNIGVRSVNNIPANGNTDPDPLKIDDQNFLRLETVEITDSGSMAIHGVDILELEVVDSVFEDNAGAPDAIAGEPDEFENEAVRLEYTQLLNDDETMDVDEFEDDSDHFPFRITFDDNELLEHETGTFLTVTQRGAEDAHLLFDFINNSDVNITAADDDEQFDNAITLTWDGPFRLNLVSNEVNLDGGDQYAFEITAESDTDELLFLMEDNAIRGEGDDPDVDDDGDSDIGALLLTTDEGDADIQVLSNLINLEGFEGTGLEFDLDADLERIDIVLSNNLIQLSTFEGTGIVFDSLRTPATLTIEGNEIQWLYDVNLGFDDALGIDFESVQGPIQLFGNVNNVINAPITGWVEFRGQEEEFNGTFIVNGVALP